jgi:hypothetical protein
MSDVIVTDPTLTAFHAPLTTPERIYFATHYTTDGELVMTKVVEPVDDNPATLKIERKDDDEKQ